MVKSQLLRQTFYQFGPIPSHFCGNLIKKKETKKKKKKPKKKKKQKKGKKKIASCKGGAKAIVNGRDKRRRKESLGCQMSAN